MRKEYFHERGNEDILIDHIPVYNELDYEGPTSLLVPEQPLEERKTPQKFVGAIRFVFQRELSVHAVYFSLLVSSLLIYCTFASIVVASWEWLDAHHLIGVATMGLLFGALGMLAIFEPLSEEENVARLIDRFLRDVGAFTTVMCLFLGGAWVTTQGVILMLRPLIGDGSAVFVSTILLALFVYGLASLWIKVVMLTRDR